MIATLSYIGAHWFLILSVVGISAALAAVAWFTKNWKAAVAAIVLVFFGLAYQSADLGGYKRRVDEAKAEQIKTLTDRLAVTNLVTSMDAYVALANAKLNTQMEDLARETPANAAVCLDAAAAHRVWAVRHLTVPGAAPLPARRVPNVLQALRRPR